MFENYVSKLRSPIEDLLVSAPHPLSGLHPMSIGRRHHHTHVDRDGWHGCMPLINAWHKKNYAFYSSIWLQTKPLNLMA